MTRRTVIIAVTLTFQVALEALAGDCKTESDGINPECTEKVCKTSTSPLSSMQTLIVYDAYPWALLTDDKWSDAYHGGEMQAVSTLHSTDGSKTEIPIQVLYDFDEFESRCIRAARSVSTPLERGKFYASRPEILFRYSLTPLEQRQLSGALPKCETCLKRIFGISKLKTAEAPEVWLEWKDSRFFGRQVWRLGSHPKKLMEKRYAD